MTVRALLNDDSSASGSSAKAPSQTSQSDHLRYDLFIRQQPERARSCGFGDRDRRVIDPPPILQLKIDGPGLSREEVSKKLRLPSYVVHSSIWSEDGEEEMSGMPDDYARQKRLMGSLVASPFVGSDEYGEEGCFFCFPDISCRTPGRYRLKFVLVVLDWPLRPNARSMVRAELLSDVFQTFSAKDFPGMLESTPLAKALKYQGCNIPTKKGNNDRGGKAEGASEDRSDGEAAYPRSRKRARNNNNNL
ncbi:hypothetical protein VMCG_00481 [Cytospora schulzeri]|uniref:Velvet domain-containing protein n=1 Tax=Cytospora schulzeri TaxID=448051 RepID=A0A423X9R4_9PEZI|nr:hypothetical protein VMCG_00481 [Valsa malicola]